MVKDSAEDDAFADDQLPPHDGTRAEDDFGASPSWLWYFYHTEQLGPLIDGESPRGAAVLCRAYLESALEELLLLHALNEFSARKSVGKALNAGLEEKIATCARLKLIDHHARSEATRLKTVGDRFAHRPDVTGADDEQVLMILKQMIGTVFFQRELEAEVTNTAVVGILGKTLLNVFAQISETVMTERERWRLRSRESEA